MPSEREPSTDPRGGARDDAPETATPERAATPGRTAGPAEILASSQELSALTYGLCHDLQAPLRAIRGFGQLLSEQHADALGDDGRKLLGLVLANAARMRQLIDGLMRYAAIGTANLRLQPLDMSRLAATVFEELQHAEPGHAVGFDLGSLPPAHGDPDLVRELWTHLIANALKFTRDSGAPAVAIGSHEVAGERVYWIRDNGVGFEMRSAAKLFEIFQRLHSLDDFPGAGVGLAITKRIVERHGGRIWAEASPDTGALFSFTLTKGVSS